MNLQQALSTWVVDSYKEALNRALITRRNLLRVRMIKTEEGSKGSKTGNPSLQPMDEGKCSRCKKKHYGRRCVVKCYGCRVEGHISRNYSKNKEIPQGRYQGRITCYSCGQPRHISRECLKRKKTEQPSGRAQNVCHGRVYNLTCEEAKADPTVIEGTLFFSNTPIHALIDPDSMHSFI